MEYTLKEMMTIIAAREIRNDDIVFCGTGISMLAAMAAKNINAPKSVIFFETGAIDSKLEDLPLAVADPRIMYQSSCNAGLLEAFATMQNKITGKHVVGILGAAQIDIYGNLNSTVIGEYEGPDVRFSGSGGACDVGSFVPRSIIFMTQEKRKFKIKIDYLTTPGYLDGPDGRKKAGLPEGGPDKVITDMGVMGFDDQTKKMYLKGYYPGITPEKILENMEFEIDTSRAEEVLPPTPEELKLLREKCDPQRLIL
ncbi:CoA-transferase subunit beta [Desulfobacula phenolica]|uniref:Glutaconate CoA-transferase subunit B n=1 Tax=Desulfobacula phenolica TaxID=90732 RepID=A0A1H2JMX6_9BACT|nr:CoA-transferase [Desulfobacula phenolica]SDU57511.1 glutaconate CoA-transferase subunit B [Desulfobacula phenolica]